AVARRARRRLQSPAVRPLETQRPVIEHLYLDLSLVHLAMMVAAQKHQIGQPRRAPVGPVPDVMAVQEARVRTARKAAAGIARLQRPANRRRDAAGLATNVQWSAQAILDDGHDACIAREPPRR